MAVRRATLREVAERAGVHPATASRALNDATRALVNADTAARVERAAQQLGYSPNPIARSLKTARSASIGLVIPDLTNPLFPPIVRGMDDVLRASGYSVWIVNTDNDPQREEEAVEAFRARSIEGYAFATARLDHPLLESLADSRTPMVLVNRTVSRAGIPSVTADDAAGVSLALHHLHDLGHRQIVHLAGPQDLSTGYVRRRAFQHGLDDLGLPAGHERISECVAWSVEAGVDAMQRMLESKVEFTAILAGNDLIALGAYTALADAGLRCPADVSVVGFNDMPFIDRVTPPLTSVHIPHREIGAEGARMLLEVLRDPTRHPRSVLLPLELRVRQSTAPVPS